MEQRDFARRLRANSTEAEKCLWRRLRRRTVAGFRWRRQAPIGPYIADFVCLEARVVVDGDGDQHADSRRDAVRDAWFAAQGFRTLRFWNHEILGNTDGVVEAIYGALTNPPTPTLPRKGGGS